jgi:hypothetical protein
VRDVVAEWCRRRCRAAVGRSTRVLLVVPGHHSPSCR